MEDPQLWAYLDQRYERLLRAVPETAGFVLTLHESDLKVFRHGDVVSREDVAGRVYRVSKLLYDVLKRHNKQLIVRNFFYEPLEMEYFKRGVDRLPDDVIVMSKDTTHEFHPFYPWDPLHGKFGQASGRSSRSTWGWRRPGTGKAPTPRPTSSAGWRCAPATPRQAGMIGRARLMLGSPVPGHARGEPVRLRPLPGRSRPDGRSGAGRLGRAPATTPRAVPHIVSALKRSEFINHHGRWHLEYWFTKEIGREWGDYAYIYSRVLQRSRFKWTRRRRRPGAGGEAVPARPGDLRPR